MVRPPFIDHLGLGSGRSSSFLVYQISGVGMFRSFGIVMLIAIGLAFGNVMPAQAGNKISVDVFKGKVATVNSFIFSNGKTLIVMDAQRATSEAKKLAKVIRAKKLPLSYILVSHGHPDHYIGMDWLLKAFPKANVVVANEEIKKDIIQFSTWMEGVGWLDAEPTLKPKSAKNPDGFDYENKIEVLSGDALAFPGGGSLRLDTRYQPAESEHVSMSAAKPATMLA